MIHIFYVTLKPTDDDRRNIAQALNFVAPVTSLHPMHIGHGDTGYCLEPDGMTEEQIDAVARATNPFVDAPESGVESSKQVIRQRGLWLLAKWCEPVTEKRQMWIPTDDAGRLALYMFGSDWQSPNALFLKCNFENPEEITWNVVTDPAELAMVLEWLRNHFAEKEGE